MKDKELKEYKKNMKRANRMFRENYKKSMLIKDNKTLRDFVN